MPEKAPTVSSLELPKLALRVGALPKQDGATSVEVFLTAGATVSPEPKLVSGADLEARMLNGSYGTILMDDSILKDGAPIKVAMRILDKDGREVQSSVGTLNAFGFS